MFSINSLPFGQLKNAEHVAFFNNVVIAIDKIGAEEIGLTVAKFTELTKKLRAESENLYGLIKLHIEYTANTEPASEKGGNCASALGVINEIVKDARTRLNQRLGRTSGDGSESGLDSNVSPIPFPNK